MILFFSRSNILAIWSLGHFFLAIMSLSLCRLFVNFIFGSLVNHYWPKLFVLFELLYLDDLYTTFSSPVYTDYYYYYYWSSSTFSDHFCYGYDSIDIDVYLFCIIIIANNNNNNADQSVYLCDNEKRKNLWP